MSNVETNPYFHSPLRYTPPSYPPMPQQPKISRPHRGSNGPPPPSAQYPPPNQRPNYPINQPLHGSTGPVQSPDSIQTSSPLLVPSTPQTKPQHSTQTPEPPGTPPSSGRTRRLSQRKTPPLTWLIGVICGLFWIAVILGGLVILVVYLLFRPRSPKFDIAQASLNAAYLDMGYLLNADMTMLVNLTNPSKKATVDFSYIAVTLLYESTPIATSYVEPFLALKSVTSFRNVHLVSSQVSLSSRDSQKLMQQIYNNRIRFEVKSELRTTSKLGGIFRYSYWLYGHCIIEVTDPPTGALLGKRCTTKR